MAITAGDRRDEDAAWRDLVSRLAAPPITDGGVPWPAREGLTVPPPAPSPTGPAERAASTADPGPEPRDETDPGPAAGRDPIPGVMPAPPQVRIVRPAVPAPIPGEDEEHYVPPPPPPLPRLDPVSKGAWLALFGGPGYLLLAVMLGWIIPGWAAFMAVAAFVGGFAALVVRLGDQPPRDSGPDNGAVV